MSTLLETFQDLEDALTSDLSVSSNSSFFTQTVKRSALNRSYAKIGGMLPWPALEDALITSTAANKDYYDAPENWRPNSMFRLQVDGVSYGADRDGGAMNYNDYLTWKEENPTCTDKKWAKQWLRYFITPTPASIGDNNISIWGFKNVEKLVNDADTTIFSSNMPECNEAVVLEAAAILRKKGERQDIGRLLSVEAKEIILMAFDEITGRDSTERKELPYFEVPDFFAGANSTGSIGNFTIR